MSNHDASLAARSALEDIISDIALGVGPSVRDVGPYVDAVVRAELAEELRRMVDQLREFESRSSWPVGIDHAIEELRQEADELDPPAVNS